MIIYFLTFLFTINSSAHPKYVCTKKHKTVKVYVSPGSRKLRGIIYPDSCFDVSSVPFGILKEGFLRFGKNAYVRKSDFRYVSRKKYISRKKKKIFELNSYGLPFSYRMFEYDMTFFSSPDLKHKTRHHFMSGSMFPGLTVGKTFETGYGYVPKNKTSYIKPSRFKGIKLRNGLKLPLVFVTGYKAFLYDRNLKPVRKIKRYEHFGYSGISKSYIKTPDGFIKKKNTRIALKIPKPSYIRKNEKWIHISLKHWTLIAYIGSKPVFATLIGKGAGTPKGKFRIRRKLLKGSMGMGGRGKYKFAIFGVPWIMEFYPRISLHTAFWHDDFGGHVTQNCVNLSPADAKFMFDWTSPSMPDGWNEIISLKNEGTLVLVTD